MFTAFRSIFALLASWGLLLVANSLLSTLLALRAEAELFSTTVVGLVTAGYFLGFFLGARYGDKLVITVGHIRAFAVYASFTSVAALLHAMVVDPTFWIIVRFAAGFCMAALVIITESWLNARATNKTRGQILSLYMAVNYLAASVGQLFIPLAIPESFLLFSVASIAYSVALVPVLLTRLIAPPVNARQHVEIIDVFKISPVGMLGAFAAGLAGSAIYGLGPIFTQTHLDSTTATAIFMSLVIFGGVLLQWPIGKLSDRMDRRKVLIVSSLISAMVSLAIVFTVELTLWLFLVTAVLFGAWSFLVYPIACAHMNDSVGPEDMIRAAAGLVIGYGAGAVIGPIIASMVMEYLGADSLFYFISLVNFAYALFVIKRTRVTPAPERKARKMWFSRFEVKQQSNIDSGKLRDQMDKDMAQLIGGKARD